MTSKLFIRKFPKKNGNIPRVTGVIPTQKSISRNGKNFPCVTGIVK